MFVDFIITKFNENLKQTALIYKDKVFTYEWLNDSFIKWRKYLDTYNIDAFSVVSIKADFSPESVGLLLALIDKGCIIVPLSLAIKDFNEFLDIAEVEYLIEIVNEQPIIQKEVKSVSHEYLLKLKHIQHPGLILFSSGTTGKPKAAVHDLVPLLDKYKIPSKEIFRTISFLLFDHIGGFNTLMHTLSNLGTIVTVVDRTPEEVCKLIEMYKVELLPTSPTFINMILFSRAYEKYDISSLKLVTYGTEPMAETTLKTFNKLFPTIKLKQTYGLSELGIMRSKSEASDSLWLKVGGEDYETKIVDGKLWIKARTAMLGYLNAPSPFIEDGWFNTGDRVEEKGEYIRFLGRDSDLINVGGEKVYPIEVESVILEIEGVKDVVVYSEPHPLVGHIVVADIKINDENNNKEFINKVKNYCREKLAKFKVPVKINIVQNSFNNQRFKKVR